MIDLNFSGVVTFKIKIYKALIKNMVNNVAGGISSIKMITPFML